MKQRTIGMMIVLTIVTLGIYMLYWLISFQMDLRRQTNEGFGGFVHFLLLLFTFGIYYLYWQYAAGKRLAKQGAQDNSLLYLILGLIGFGWLNVFLMQSEANRLR